MTGEELKKLVKQIKKYHLERVFKTSKVFDEWLKKLNTKQIRNFNNLTVDINEIHFPVSLLINENLLNCEDYTNRINAMLKLKNIDKDYHQFDNLCSTNFLNSKNYYEDIEMISKAPSNIKYSLWIITKDAFINSPYHKEDLELIIASVGKNKENETYLDWLVQEALTTVAIDQDSINSPYHQQDMQLIAKADSKCLQPKQSLPENSLNTLATNKVSLNDKYHLENMEILAQNPISRIFLYELMTNPEIINGDYYREEINALKVAKSPITALAIYNYIINPEDSEIADYSYQLFDLNLDIKDIMKIQNKNGTKGHNNPNYLKYLELLNKIDDKFVLYVQSLLSNKTFANSQFRDHDLKILLSEENKDFVIDLYDFMASENALNSCYHLKDLEIINKTDNKTLKRWLISTATDENSINSRNHEYDMEYISKLDLNKIDTNILPLIHFCLSTPIAISHPKHIEILEKALNGIETPISDIIISSDEYKKSQGIKEHLDYLENNSEKVVKELQKSHKILSKIRQKFKKNKRGKQE